MIYEGRTEGMNQWKSGHVVKTSARTLADALEGADVFFGLSAKGAVTPEMVKSMAAKPIIFAMANPDPEITAEEVAAVRDDAIMATGRSDYPNQINNVLGFPYIFRGALDVRATTINMEMKIAAAHALAALAREDVPDEVAAAYGARPKFGPGIHHSGAVRPAADFLHPAGSRQGRHGHRRRAQADRRHEGVPRAVALAPRSGRRRARRRVRAAAPPAAARGVRRRRGRTGHPRRREFRAAGARHARFWSGREDRVKATAKDAGIEIGNGVEIINARLSTRNATYSAYLYERLQRKGFLQRDVPAAGQSPTATTSPPAWSRSATPTRWSRASPAISRSCWKTCSAASTQSPAIG